MDFKERLNRVTLRNGKITKKVGNQWPQAKRYEVAKAWLLIGQLPLVEAATGVDIETIKNWKEKPWWPEIIAEIRAGERIEMDKKLTDIVQVTLDATFDRVVNGDYVWDQRASKVIRKPCALRDIHRVAVDLLGKRELLRDKSELIGDHKQTSVEEHLKVLATQMGQWFENKKKPIILEEVEDAVYEERETGLQAGERSVQLPPGDCEEEGGEECGSEGSDENGPSA